MRRETIKGHLRAYSIYARRATTINHAFASAIALNYDYDDAVMIQAIRDLGQDPDDDLYCAYCGVRPAETWDHVYGLVMKAGYSGFGHTVGNLLPCCKTCNSSKGNRNWKDFLRVIAPDKAVFESKVRQLERYFELYGKPQFTQAQMKELCSSEMQEYQLLRQHIMELMKRADKVAQEIRKKTAGYLENGTLG